MTGLKIYIPQALAFQRVAKTAIAAANQVDHGTEINEAHAFALLEFFEFLAPEQMTSHMGPGLAAEFSAVVENELSGDPLRDRNPLQALLHTHASVFAALFCCDGEEPRCYRTWLQDQKKHGGGSSCDRQACLLANFDVAIGLSHCSNGSNPKLRLLKYRIAARTAELLIASGFRPDATLGEIQKDEVPTSAQILAMQVFVLLKKNPEDLARVCGWSESSCEATFLHWAAKDSFVGGALIAWRWLNPVSYDQFPDAPSECLGDHPGPLYTAWRQGKTAPARLAIREEPWTEADEEHPFPCLLPKDVKLRFSPVPLMLIGGAGVGKTAFLCALAKRLMGGCEQVREGMYMESSDLQDLLYPVPGRRALSVTPNTSGTSSYNLLVRDSHDPEVARWMRLRLTDYDGEDLSQGTLSPEFVKNLQAARGLLFFLDDRHFLATSSNGNCLKTNDYMDMAEPVARYTRILQRYFDVNKDAMHLPIALVVNKADLLLGPTNLLALNPPFLIPEGTKMELVHTGLHTQGEPEEPFERVRSCIRYNLRISQNSENQRFVFHLIERFKGFITAAMCHTYRFQIFLTCSESPKNKDGKSSPHGVWEVAKWMVNQFEQEYRLQASESVEQAHAELKEMRSLLEVALIRDHEAYADFFRAAGVRKQLISKMRVNILDHLLQDRMDDATTRMEAALQDTFALAELPAVSDETDPAPFVRRRRMAREAMERLDYQLGYLNEWLGRLSGVQKSFLSHPKKPVGPVTTLSNQFMSERRAS
jgi:hypothetical protein